MSDIHTLSGAYAVDALDERERTEFERHLGECADCRAEVDSLREAAAAISLTIAEAPPASLRAEVLAGISSVRPLPPLVPTASVPRARRPRRHWATRIGVAAAAAVLVVAGAGGAIWHPWSRHSGSYASLAALVVTAPDAQQFRRTLADGAQLTVYRSASLGRAAIATSGLPAAPEGKVYELWLESPAGSMRPAGLMPGGADTAVALQGDATSAKGMGVTVEPAGGSPSPTSTPIVLVAFGT